MPFFYKTGLANFWSHIMARLSTKVERSELDDLETSINERIETNSVTVDQTLSVEGQAADAKAVGEAIGSIEHIVATDDGNGIITLSLSPLTPADREVF